MLERLPLDLDMLANDITEAMNDEWYGLDVDPAAVRRALVPFLDAVVPGVLTDEQRAGQV